MSNNRPKLLIIAIKAIILHTFGVQVGLRGWGLEFGFRLWIAGQSRAGIVDWGIWN